MSLAITLWSLNANWTRKSPISSAADSRSGKGGGCIVPPPPQKRKQKTEEVVLVDFGASPIFQSMCQLRAH